MCYLRANFALQMQQRVVSARLARRLMLVFLAALLLLVCGAFVPMPLLAQDDLPCIKEYWCDMGQYPSAEMRLQEQLAKQDAVEANPVLIAPVELSPAAAEYAANQLLVFQSFRDGNWEIYRSRLDGYNLMRLTANDIVDSQPQLGPDMQNIVFVSDRDAAGVPNLYLMALDGSNVRRLTYEWGAVSPRWAPDGKWIYFTAYNVDANGQVIDYDVKRVNVASGAVQMIVGGGAADFDVSFKPDGSEIIWVRKIDSQNGVMMRSSPDGSQAYQYGPQLRFLGNPVWSVGGALVLEFANEAGFNSIYAYNVSQTYGMLKVPLRLGGERPADGQRRFVEYSGSTWTHTTAIQYGAPAFVDHLLYNEIEYVVSGGQVTIQRRMSLARFDEIAVTLVDEISQLGHTTVDASPHARWIDTTPPTFGVYPLPAFSQFGGKPFNWRAQDSGGSGLFAIEVQLSDSGCCNWRFAMRASATDKVYPCDYQHFYPTADTYPAQPYYRIRALDVALNHSAWSQPLTTTCYHLTITTRVTDVRGKPIAGVGYSDGTGSLPAGLSASRQSDRSGIVQAWVWDNFDYAAEISVWHPVYGRTTAGSLGSGASGSMPSNTYYISPVGPNLIDDGGFDEGDTGASWTWGWSQPGNGGFGGAAALLNGSDPVHLSTYVAQKIPVDPAWTAMTNPTLTFAYRFSDGRHWAASEEATASHESLVSEAYDTITTIPLPEPASVDELDTTDQTPPYFEVIVRETATLSDTIVHRRAGNYTNWRVIWVDMSSWVGKEIEILFALQNPDLVSSQSSASIDNVSLSPWRTPLVSVFSPEIVETPAGATLMITGGNFIDTPSVVLTRQLGTATSSAAAEDVADTHSVLEASTVIRQGETLRMALPANLNPGIYFVRVVNPGGDMGYAPGTLIVGKPVYLPIVAR